MKQFWMMLAMLLVAAPALAQQPNMRTSDCGVAWTDDTGQSNTFKSTCDILINLDETGYTLAFGDPADDSQAQASPWSRFYFFDLGEGPIEVTGERVNADGIISALEDLGAFTRSLQDPSLFTGTDISFTVTPLGWGGTGSFVPPSLRDVTAEEAAEAWRPVTCILSKGHGRSTDGFDGPCLFSAHGAGSFDVQRADGQPIFDEMTSLSVKIDGENEAVVTGTTLAGTTTSLGRVSRSTFDTACWVSRDLELCAF
ncbi:MAG: hypothetical protein AAF638_09440 [Pseudomonadota bacterium]